MDKQKAKEWVIKRYDRNGGWTPIVTLERNGTPIMRFYPDFFMPGMQDFFETKLNCQYPVPGRGIWDVDACHAGRGGAMVAKLLFNRRPAARFYAGRFDLQLLQEIKLKLNADPQ